MSNLQGSLWYHTTKPAGKVTADVINFLCVLSGGAILAGVWTILYYVNSTAFTFTLLSALLLHTSHTVFNNKVCTRVLRVNCVYGTIDRALQGVTGRVHISLIKHFHHTHTHTLTRLGDLGGNATARTCIM